MKLKFRITFFRKLWFQHYVTQVLNMLNQQLCKRIKLFFSFLSFQCFCARVLNFLK